MHYTHYGRLCPIESPEGPNIGLISSLCVYARISPMGFIETPYRTVENGKVDLDNSHIRYYSAEEEEGKIVAQSNVPLGDDGSFLEPDRVKAREGADFPVVTASEVNLMDVAPEPDRLDRRQPDPLPGARRRKPCPDGFEHDAPGRAPGNLRSPDRRHGYREGHDLRQPHPDCGRR